MRPAAKVLGRMLAEALTALEPDFEQASSDQGKSERQMFDQAPILVIPVPLYKTKRRQRGFNQAELIARAALKLTSAPESGCSLPRIFCSAPATPIRRSA